MDEESGYLLIPAGRRASSRMPTVVMSVAVLLVAVCGVAALAWQQQQALRGVGPVELAATKPWGIDRAGEPPLCYNLLCHGLTKITFT